MPSRLWRPASPGHLSRFFAPPAVSLCACFVSAAQGERITGEQAAASLRPQNLLTSMKRLLGRPYSDPFVQRELSRLPFRHQCAPDGYGVEVCVATGEGKEEVFSPEQLTAAMLHACMNVASEWPANMESRKKPREVVVSVPGWFNGAQRCAMQQACKIAGLECVRTLNDLTAAALDYAYFRSAKKEFQKDAASHVLFLDMGQCGLSASVVALYEGRLEVGALLPAMWAANWLNPGIRVSHVCQRMSTHGLKMPALYMQAPSALSVATTPPDSAFQVLSSSHDPWCGGREFDALIVEQLAQTFEKNTGVAIGQAP